MKPVAGLLIGAALLAIITIGVRKGRSTADLRPVLERKAPMKLTIPRLDGGEWSIMNERGKVVLVNFWASWCAPCREETPWLVTLSQRYGAQGLLVVGVSMDEERNLSAVREFAAKYRIPYPILWPGDGSPFEKYIAGLPTSMLADRQGRLAKTYEGRLDEDEVQRAIETLLAEQP
jgi:cytochrome c biogenesis protein CcmG, thiol:disulfide interchange protein DsbE